MSAKLAGRLFTQRRFLPLFALFQAGTFNDNALKNALIALVLTGGITLFSGLPVKSVVPLAAILFTGPFLILCAIAGQIADKHDRGLILKVIKRVEVGIMIFASLGFLFENAFILCATLVAMGAQSAFFSPTKNAVLPQWLKEDELITGNGLLSGFQFFTILLGTVFGTILFQLNFPEGGLLTGSRIISAVLMFLALIGWFAAERVPLAPAPTPELKIDYNPITAIWGVLKFAWADKPVFRPMLGIAWFYGLSTIMITALPNYVFNVMNYDLFVLSFIQASTTIAILIGSLLCVVLAKGKEALGFVVIGIIGVTLFSMDLYLSDNTPLHAEQASLDVFLAAKNTPRFIIDIFGASLCAGLFVIPLQAMAQRRSNPQRRARLMAAGAVMLNLSVNVFTLMLVALGLSHITISQDVPHLIKMILNPIIKLINIMLDLIPTSPNIPFLIISLVSAIVAAYAARRWFQIRKLASLT